MSVRVPLIGLAVALLLGVAFVFLLYQPKSEEQESLQAETAQLQAQQASLRAEIAQLEQVRADEPRIREVLTRLNELIPPEVAQPQALDEFQQLGEESSVEILSLNFSDPAPAVPPVPAPEGKQLGVITTVLVLEGEYFQTLDFLRRIEQEGPRAVLVEGLSFAPGAAGYPSLAATVTAKLFALIPATPVDVVAAPPAPVPSPGASPTPATTEAAVPPPLPTEENTQ